MQPSSKTKNRKKTSNFNVEYEDFMSPFDIYQDSSDSASDESGNMNSPTIRPMHQTYKTDRRMYRGGQIKNSRANKKRDNHDSYDRSGHARNSRPPKTKREQIQQRILQQQEQWQQQYMAEFQEFSDNPNGKQSQDYEEFQIIKKQEYPYNYTNIDNHHLRHKPSDKSQNSRHNNSGQNNPKYNSNSKSNYNTNTHNIPSNIKLQPKQLKPIISPSPKKRTSKPKATQRKASNLKNKQIPSSSIPNLPIKTQTSINTNPNSKSRKKNRKSAKIFWQVKMGERHQIFSTDPLLINAHKIVEESNKMADNYNRIIAQIKSKHFCSQHNTERVVPELKHFIMFCNESLKYEFIPSFKTVMSYFHLSLPYRSTTSANESMNRQQQYQQLINQMTRMIAQHRQQPIQEQRCLRDCLYTIMLEQYVKVNFENMIQNNDDFQDILNRQLDAKIQKLKNLLATGFIIPGVSQNHAFMHLQIKKEELQLQRQSKEKPVNQNKSKINGGANGSAGGNKQVKLELEGYEKVNKSEMLRMQEIEQAIKKQSYKNNEELYQHQNMEDFDIFNFMLQDYL